MKESDFIALKRELWEIIRSEGIVVTNQNLDWIMERAYHNLASKIAAEILDDLSASFIAKTFDPTAPVSKGG